MATYYLSVLKLTKAENAALQIQAIRILSNSVNKNQVDESQPVFHEKFRKKSLHNIFLHDFTAAFLNNHSLAALRSILKFIWRNPVFSSEEKRALIEIAA